MALSKFVKISKIDNLSDARYCAGMQAEMLGFNLVPGTDRYMDPETFSGITEWVAGVKLVGEFGNLPPADVKIISQDYRLDYIETSNMDYLEELHGIGKNMILKVNDVTSDKHLSTILEYTSGLAEYCIFSTSHHDLTKQLTTISAKEMPLLIRGFDINGKTIIKLDPVWSGIELEGTPEERPGYTDYGTVMDILEALEVD